MHQWLSEEIVEVLETLWTLEERDITEEKHKSAVAINEVSEEWLAQCEQDGYITRHGGEIKLTPLGRQTASEIIRRHRLAERLVVDVLGMTLEESEADACEFEHVLAQGVTDAICTLLGHPRFCPHNHPIPPGACCQQSEAAINPFVASLDRLDTGERAQVSYVSAANFPRIQKLFALGVAPGVPIKVLQKSPSFVIQCDETQIALERDIARDIYVWRNQTDSTNNT